MSKIYKLEKIEYKKVKISKLDLLLEGLKIKLGVVIEMIGIAKDLAIAINKTAQGIKRSNNKKFVIFDMDSNVMRLDEDVSNDLELDKIKKLEIHYYVDMYGYGKYHEPPRLKYECHDKLNVIHFEASHYTVINLCKSLYDKKIKFKEFISNKRCYIGKKQTSIEVQELDKSCHIDW